MSSMDETEKQELEDALYGEIENTLGNWNDRMDSRYDGLGCADEIKERAIKRIAKDFGLEAD